jgi:hypothetical protein
MQFYSHLSGDERDHIAILRAAGRSMGAIARALGRAKTTIIRELQRNALPSGGYSRRSLSASKMPMDALTPMVAAQPRYRPGNPGDRRHHHSRPVNASGSRRLSKLY